MNGGAVEIADPEAMLGHVPLANIIITDDSDVLIATDCTQRTAAVNTMQLATANNRVVLTTE